MVLDEILTMDATISENISRGVVLELFQQGWRLYSHKTTWDIEGLINRYLASHARLPGVLTDESFAWRPIEVFYFRENGIVHRGALFLNGAVYVQQDLTTGDTATLLFVSNETAEKWVYPDGFVET